MDYEDTYQGMFDESRGTVKQLRAHIAALTAERDAARERARSWKASAKNNRRAKLVYFRRLGECGEQLTGVRNALPKDAKGITPAVRVLRLKEQRDAALAELARLRPVPANGTYQQHIIALEARNDVLTQENQNLSQEVQRLRTEIHDTLNEIQAERWGKHAVAVNAAAGQEGE